MFDFKNKINQQPKIESEVDSEQKVDVKENSSKNDLDKTKVDLSNLKIHTMPAKFLDNGDKKNVSTISAVGKTGKRSISGLQKNILFGVLIGVLVIGLLGLAAFLLLKTIESPQNQENIQINTEQPQSAQESSNIEKDKEFEENIDIIDEKEQDIEEYQEILDEESSPYDFEEENLSLLPAFDEDNDLLSEEEEKLWGTDVSNEDTDGDGYLDGEEILNLYDPNSNQGGKLTDIDLIQTYVNSNFGYSIIYPSQWKLTKDELGEQVIFNSTTGEFVQVILQENYGGFLTAHNWYLSQNPGAKVEDLEEVLIGNWSGIRSPDKLNVYLINSNYIYTVVMNIGLKNELNYNTTFEMMLNSFKLFENPL